MLEIAPKTLLTGAEIAIGIYSHPLDYALVQASGAAFIAARTDVLTAPELDDAEFERLVLPRLQNPPAPFLYCNCFLPAELPCVGPSADPVRILERARRVFRRARALDLRWIVFGSGDSRRIPEGFSAVAARRQFLQLLRQLAETAADYGLVLLLEQMNTRESNFLTRFDEVLEVVRELASPQLYAIADLYHVALEGDPLDVLEGGLDLIKHIEIAQPRGRLWPHPKGDYDFRPHLARFAKAGWSGNIAIEGVPPSSRPGDSLQILAQDLQEAGFRIRPSALADFPQIGLRSLNELPLQQFRAPWGEFQ
ncbi:MAG: hypothetical protein RL095_862 [Verrucomicrobiota bacterium]